ncbi:two-component system response regulator [Maribacter sp. 2308TA10-17]|uniref:response regulator n=1 Tax=Maribacter sp. 2308TA10-17 TaxID=3386276 RepID=UPI0039BCF277
MTKINSICIIDDDPITVFGMRKMLDSLVSYDTINTFENGKLAIDGIKDMIFDGQQIPEVIFLDINMPIMDGWQFLEEFIALPITNKVRINIITSSIDSTDEQNWKLYKGKTHHTVTYNHKPIRKQEIAEITKVA